MAARGRNVGDVPPLTKLYNDKRMELGDPKKGRPMSHRDAAARSGDAGRYETFRKIGNGTHSGELSEETVQALIALGLDERQVRRAAGHQLEVSPGRFELPARADRLTRSQREVVLSVVEAILNASAQPRRLEAVPDRLAAREGKSRGRSLRAAQDEAAERGDT